MKYERHGESKTRLYRVYRGMIGRCHIESDGSYKSYGGKNIFVCDEWRNDYVCFRAWALTNGYSKNLTIDRRDNQKGYSPLNCRWITQHEQVLSQDRFSHRKKDDRHLIFLENGKVVVVIGKNRKTNYNGIHATFDNIEQARVERNFLEFCLDNSLKYKYPYFIDDVKGNKKGDRKERKLQQRGKIMRLLNGGMSPREISKKLKMPTLPIWKIKKDRDDKLAIHIDKRVQILSRMT